MFAGYFKNPERTKEAFSADGFFKTGDVFRRDKHGNFYCVDRLKELIKYSKHGPFPPKHTFTDARTQTAIPSRRPS